ncbi:hypothetical protein BRADI_2g50615v3 [Brachypodium distachyon]|uniref:Uncharacterized protein n=1 Tax=Brachypodium distachyon TaxID=15368 RepID=A0A2K2DF44_BRADI|nr:hypothetical protein BRADI_2g50615v3 [Brachypodium distachyon]
MMLQLYDRTFDSHKVENTLLQHVDKPATERLGATQSNEQFLTALAHRPRGPERPSVASLPPFDISRSARVMRSRPSLPHPRSPNDEDDIASVGARDKTHGETRRRLLPRSRLVAQA